MIRITKWIGQWSSGETSAKKPCCLTGSKYISWPTVPQLVHINLWNASFKRLQHHLCCVLSCKASRQKWMVYEWDYGMENVGIIKCWTGGSEVFQDSINKAWLHYSRNRTVDHTHKLCSETQQETKGKIQATYRNSALLHVSELQLSLCALC